MCDPKAGGSSSSKSGGNGGNNKLNIVSSKQNIDGKSRYNQEYWANQIKSKADGGLGLTQAEVAAAQKAIGMDKAYSGDKVVTTANKDTAAFKLAKVTGSDATIQNGGVTKTTSKSGLFGENTTDNYDYSGNNPDVTVKTTDPVLDIYGNKIRVGPKKSTTFVDGTATNTVTNATGAANGVNSVVTKANADDINDTKVADTVVSGSGTGTTKAKDTKGTVVVKKDEGAVTKKAVPVADTSLGGGANNANSALANKNSLAIARNRRSKSRRRYLRSGTAVAGGGNTSLNIPT